MRHAILLRKFHGQLGACFQGGYGLAGGFAMRPSLGAVALGMVQLLAIVLAVLLLAFLFVDSASAASSPMLGFVAMGNLRELREQRAREVEAGRAILKKAEDEKRELTTEERTNFDRAFDAQQKLSDRITLEERQREAERSVLEERAARGGRENSRDDRSTEELEAEQRNIDKFLEERGFDRRRFSERTAKRATAQYERDFRNKLAATTQEEARALSAGLDTEGGFTVAPVQWAAGLLKALDNEVFVRRYAMKETVETAAELGIMTLEADPADADWTTELATGSEDSTMSFGKRSVKPHPFAKRLKVSKTLLRRSTRNIDAIVRERMAYKGGVTEEKGYLTGTGNLQPLGVYVASDLGIPTSRDVSTDNTTTEITADGLINAKYSLKSQYLRVARWNWHRDTMKMIAKFKDQNDQYLWMPSLREGQPDTVLGLPYDMSEYAPNTFTAGQYVAILAAWSAGYQIADALDMSIQVLTELYAETNQNGYILRKETDGQPVLAEAFARVQLAAS